LVFRGNQKFGKKIFGGKGFLGSGRFGDGVFDSEKNKRGKDYQNCGLIFGAILGDFLDSKKGGIQFYQRGCTSWEIKFGEFGAEY